MPNKLNTDKTLKNFLNKKRLIITKIANNTVNYFQGKVFDTEGAALGSRWKKSERAKKDGGKTLVKTGKGKRSIKEIVLSDSKAIIKPSVKYMDHHQTGTRPFMGNSRELLLQNEKIIDKEMAKI